MKQLYIILIIILFIACAKQPLNTNIYIVTSCQFLEDSEYIQYWIQKRPTNNLELYTYQKLITKSQIYNIGDTLKLN